MVTSVEKVTDDLRSFAVGVGLELVGVDLAVEGIDGGCDLESVITRGEYTLPAGTPGEGRPGLMGVLRSPVVPAGEGAVGEKKTSGVLVSGDDTSLPFPLAKLVDGGDTSLA